MTIFDSIKYPIGIPPTKEQLEALPADLYWDWINNHTVDWRTRNEREQKPQFVHNWMSATLDEWRNDPLYPVFLKEVETDIAALRKLILEYEPV